MVDGIGTTGYSFDHAGQLASEDGPWANDTVSYTSTANLMRGQMQVQQPNAAAWVQNYSYDSANRLSTLTSPTGTFGYHYTSADGVTRPAQLIQQIDLPNLDALDRCGPTRVPRPMAPPLPRTVQLRL